MNADAAFDVTPYLSLLRPTPEGSDEIAVRSRLRLHVLVISPSVITELIHGPSWRERLVGLAFAVMSQPSSYVEQIVKSMKDSRGLSIVPGFAALVVGLRLDALCELPRSVCLLERSAFDGEIGWAIEKAMFHLGQRCTDPGGTAPNSSQVFEDELNFYDWLRAMPT